MVLSAAVIIAIGTIFIGLMSAKPFLIFIGMALFLVPLLATTTLAGQWWIILIVVLVLIIKFTGGKK